MIFLNILTVASVAGLGTASSVAGLGCSGQGQAHGRVAAWERRTADLVGILARSNLDGNMTLRPFDALKKVHMTEHV